MAGFFIGFFILAGLRQRPSPRHKRTPAYPASASKFNLKKRHVKQLVRIIAIMHQPLILLTL
jgi:hypothetical protein